MRPITALNLPDCTPATVTSAPPRLRQVAPGDLHVDEAYQRSLSERSIKLIRKLGMRYEKQIRLTPEAKTVDLYARVFDARD